MQITALRVYMMVAAAIFNPLLLKDNTTISEPLHVKELEEQLAVDQKPLLMDCEMLNHSSSHKNHSVSPLTLVEPEESETNEKETSADKERQETSAKGSIIWYVCEVLLFVVLHGIKCVWQNLKQPVKWNASSEDEDLFASRSISTTTMSLNTELIRSFYERNFHVSSQEVLRVRDFVKGFADDLLKAMKDVCGRVANIEQEAIGVGSMYELWSASKPWICDLIIPITPAEPYIFKFHLWWSHTTDVPPHLQGYGRIKVEKINKHHPGCLCDTVNQEEDMICLLHDSKEVPGSADTFNYLLCRQNSAYLSRACVLKWFYTSVAKAWETVSYKYDFDLLFPSLNSPQLFKVRFRSGMTVAFNITPVVKYEDTEAYFVPHLGNFSSIDWCLSSAVYEKHLLKYLAKSLPPDSCHIHCLQTLSFLHKKQILLTGKCALSNYHFKTALMHLLLSKKFSDWSVEHLKDRLCDILGFLQKSLKEKKLHHIFIGNPHVPQEVNIPAMCRTAKPVNLFSPFLSDRACYAKTVEYFQELLKNTPVLIWEYTVPLTNGHK